MKLVVSDASPVHYLVLIGAIHILPRLFSKVVIPEHIVSRELQSPNTPPLVRNWVANLPAWVEVRRPLHPKPLRLHVGEAHAIALALELGAPVLLDEKEARQIAKDNGLIVIGTVGLIERAAEMNLLNLREALAALRKTNVRISNVLLDQALQRHSQRTPPSRGEPKPPSL
jgi:predicted nucleic acid-binding protein